MEQLTWELCRTRIDEWSLEVEEHLNITANQIQLYRTTGDNMERLVQILSELNYRVMRLGDFQAKYRRLELWTTKRYDIEKGLAAVQFLRDKKPATFAKEAKYEVVQAFLDTMVDASAMHMRVQNGRSSARDTTEAIRSQISVIKGAIRSS